jgi:hypothetical protein
MTERRRVETAMGLTTEQRAFIERGTSAEQATNKQEKLLDPDTAPRVSGLPTPVNQSIASDVGPTEPFSTRRVLVPLTTRLQPETAHVLRRAILHQRLQGQVPATVREIVEAAINRWLRDHGFWSGK